MRFNTSPIEIDHLFKSWLAISLAFAIAMNGFSLSFKFLLAVLMAGFTVGLGFLLHELAHKIVAQHFGCFAEFRASMNMLILAILISFSGFIFAAPGAVLISGHVTKRKNGIISMAGPLTNIILAILFLGLLQLGVFTIVMRYGFLINSWLALFNMIPFGVFDGSKVLRWNKFVYGLMVAVCLVLLFSQTFFA